MEKRKSRASAGIKRDNGHFWLGVHIDWKLSAKRLIGLVLGVVVYIVAIHWPKYLNLFLDILYHQ